MRMTEIQPQENWVLSVVADDGRVGSFDVSPYLAYEAFEELRNHGEFSKISRKCWNVRPDPVTVLDLTP